MPASTAGFRLSSANAWSAWTRELLRIAAVCLIALAGAGAEEDPRPQVLIVGGGNCGGPGTAQGWPERLSALTDAWRIVVDQDPARRLVDLPPRIVAIAGSAGRSRAVVIVPDCVDVGETGGAPAAATALAACVVALRSAPETQAATIVLATPFPPIEARLDRWMRPRFAGAEPRAAALAEAVRALAERERLGLIDLYAAVLADRDEAGSGAFMAGSGASMRGPAHARFAATVALPALQALAIAPEDPAAFARWRRWRAQDAGLDRVLAATGEALPDCVEPPLAVTVEAGKGRVAAISIPAALLRGTALDLMLAAEDGSAVAVDLKIAGSDAELPMLRMGDRSVRLRRSDWRVLDETTPDEVVPHEQHGLNAGKWRPIPVLRETPGRRRRLLLRFDLRQVARGEAADALLLLPLMSVRERSTPTGIAPFDPGVPWRMALQARVLTGSDVAWDSAAATWRTRDGALPWTGGAADAPRRADALRAFLAAGDLEPAVRARAEAAAPR